LNPKKLIEVGFSPLHKRMTMSRTIKLYKLPAEPATPGFRQMVPADADAVTALLESKLTAYRLAPVLDVEEVRVLLPRRLNPLLTHTVSQCSPRSSCGRSFESMGVPIRAAGLPPRATEGWSLEEKHMRASAAAHAG